jgi:hypothetical protein
MGFVEKGDTCPRTLDLASYLRSVNGLAIWPGKEAREPLWESSGPLQSLLKCDLSHLVLATNCDHCGKGTRGVWWI